MASLVINDPLPLLLAHLAESHLLLAEFFSGSLHFVSVSIRKLPNADLRFSRLVERSTSDQNHCLAHVVFGDDFKKL